MIRKLARGLVVALMIGAPLSAEVKYTVKMSMREAPAAASAAPADPMMSMIGGMISEMLVPPGGAEMTGLIGDKGSRVVYTSAYLMFPAGAIAITKPDGSMVVLNPADKTYWKSPASENVLPPGMTPTVTSKRTGEFADVAGVRSEKIAVEIRIKIPLPEGVAAPPGMPSELTMSGDIWVTDKFKSATKVSSAMMGALGSLGLDKITAGGWPMRSLIRSPLFPGKEIETLITQIGEEAAPAGAFDVPADYKEVPAPTGIGRIGGAPRG